MSGFRIPLFNFCGQLSTHTKPQSVSQRLFSSHLSWLFAVADGPADENLSITGPPLFPTDGSKALNLTCLAHEVNPAPSYTWSGVTCDNGNLGNTCSFRPQPEEDGKRVACVASASFVGMSVKSASRVFMLHLQCQLVGRFFFLCLVFSCCWFLVFVNVTPFLPSRLIG